MASLANVMQKIAASASSLFARCIGSWVTGKFLMEFTMASALGSRELLSRT